MASKRQTSSRSKPDWSDVAKSVIEESEDLADRILAVDSERDQPTADWRGGIFGGDYERIARRARPAWLTFCEIVRGDLAAHIRASSRDIGCSYAEWVRTAMMERASRESGRPVSDFREDMG